MVSIEDDECDDNLPNKLAEPDAEEPTEKIIVKKKRGRPPQRNAASAQIVHNVERPKRSQNHQVKSDEPVFKKKKSTAKNTDIISIEQIEAVVKKAVKEAMEGSSKLRQEVQQQGIVCVLL